MDFTIHLRAEGTAETRAQAEAVKAVRTELEKTQKKTETTKLQPRKVREAKEDRELDRAAAKAQKDLIKYERDQEKSAARQAAIAQKKADQETKESAKKIERESKDAARKAALDERRIANEQRLAARQNEIEKRRADAEQKQRSRAEAQREKEAARKLAQNKKQEEREDKELERAASKAQRDLIRYEKEKAREEERASKEAEKAKSGGGGGSKASLSSAIALKTVIAQQAAEALKFAVGLGRAGFGLALGYQGTARLAMISAQASFNMRRLFTGTNPRPLLDALQRTGQLIDPRTFTGKTLGDFLTRSANSVFALLAKAEPYARLFFKGMLLGALQVEGAWLKLRIAIQPALNLLPPGIGLMTAFGAGALAVKAAFGLMGVGLALGVAKAAGALLSFGISAATATAPLLPYALAIGGVVAAVTQLKELMDAWDENSFSQITTKLKSDLGIASKEETDVAMSKRQGILTGDDYDRRFKLGKYAEKPATPTPKGAEKQAATAGPPIGKNLGLGIVAGMKDTQAKVEAGGRDLVLAAEGGAKSAAEIKSPARKWRREIGRNLGEGAALGLEDSADRVEEAARAVVPGAPIVSGVRAGRSGVVIQSIGPFYGMPEGGEQQVRRWVFDAIDDAAERIGALA